MAKIKATKKVIGTKFFKEGTQNQKILQNYWGNGKTFTAQELGDKLDIASPGARLTELKEAGFDIRTVDSITHGAGRPVSEYKIMKRRALA